SPPPRASRPSPRGCCWRDCHAARSRRVAAALVPRSARWLRTTSARVRLPGRGASPPNWWSRSCRKRRFCSPPIQLGSRALLSSCVFAHDLLRKTISTGAKRPFGSGSCALEKRFSRGRCDVDQRSGIDEVQEIKKTRDRQHRAQLDAYRIQFADGLVEIHH